ncbi:hypothetical protein ACFOKI_06820 [Sphingomonas qilianensis]|uniref:Uncharacterized protein n=1 Tax=Sphingomonas qilianensis TaxID=1736690 RepID=A0ABU9XTI5_9SPHN
MRGIAVRPRYRNAATSIIRKATHSREGTETAVRSRRAARRAPARILAAFDRRYAVGALRQSGEAIVCAGGGAAGKRRTECIGSKTRAPADPRSAARIANPLVAILLVAASIAGATGDLASFVMIVSVILVSTMRWTGASDRTARNWMSGAAGPSGYHLICLARESNAVLAAMLALSGRPELALSTDVQAVEVALAKAMGSLEVLKRQQASRPMR